MTAADAVAVPATAVDYLGLSAEQRYEVVSQKFPDWLVTEPIEFPAHHPTYGWACLVEACKNVPPASAVTRLCVAHNREFRQDHDGTDLATFASAATGRENRLIGWALVRKSSCAVEGCSRESRQSTLCNSHHVSWSSAKYRGRSWSDWVVRQRPLPPYEACSVDGCVHDGIFGLTVGDDERPLCCVHHERLSRLVKSAEVHPDHDGWAMLMQDPVVLQSVRPVESRGQLSLARLPELLQREIRYALYQHANTASRSRWSPPLLQEIVDTLAAAAVESVHDSAFAVLASQARRVTRRIWIGLPIGARSLTVTADSAKAAGWFDPILVGGSPFGSNPRRRRVKPWNLTSVTQPWLRDLLWDHLRDESLRPEGKRPTGGPVWLRITGVSLLSATLHQNRADHGLHPGKLTAADVEAVKQTWELWLREQIPLPPISDSTKQRVLTPITLAHFMGGVRTVLRTSLKHNQVIPELAPFILSWPEYGQPPRKPRPRPLSYGDFQLLISPDSLRALDDLDHDNVGYSDIWLAQAFQGGRIGETLTLRLGCVGLVGAAQPYLWRDISKVGVLDYGMPCHLPVYQRLLRRRQVTLAKLRLRYRDQLNRLDDLGKMKLEESWDREMPLFPSAVRNPDLLLEVSQCGFRKVWSDWFQQLGLTSITTHQTRATLATSLLNNGAPPALVRQLLGHFSEEALAHYANYNDATMKRHLQKVWVAGPGMDKPGTILLRPTDMQAEDPAVAAARIDLTTVPIEHGLCRYGPVVGGASCPWGKNCTDAPHGPCEHFVLTGADLSYWERKRDAAYHFAEGAPTDDARDYILSQWQPWESVLTGLREALNELGLLEEAEKLDLRAPVHDYFDPVFSTGWPIAQLNPAANTAPERANQERGELDDPQR